MIIIINLDSTDEGVTGNGKKNPPKYNLLIDFEVTVPVLV